MTRVTLVTAVCAAVWTVGCCNFNLPERKEADKETPVLGGSKPGATPVQGTSDNRPSTSGPSEIPDIPEGRSNPPTVAEWASARQVNTQEFNSRAPNCFQKVVREWLKIHCEGDVIRVEEKTGFGTHNVDHYESVVPGKFADYIVRLRRGTVITAKIYRTEGNAAVFVNWPAGAPKPVHIAIGRGS